MNKIVLIGNCQTLVFNVVLKAILPNSQIDSTTLTNAMIKTFDSEAFLLKSKQADVVLFQRFNPNISCLVDQLKMANVNLIEFPVISYLGQHPDCVYLRDGTLISPITYHSIIVVAAFLLNLDEAQCYKLFNEKVYRKLGYLDMPALEIERLKKDLHHIGIPVDLIDKWYKGGDFMHTINHPKLFVLEDFIKALLTHHNIAYRPVRVAGSVIDQLQGNMIFPSYFEPLGGHVFSPEELFFKSGQGKFYSLEEFIAASYTIYRGSENNKERMGHARFNQGGIEKIESIFREHLATIERQVNQTHPYKNKPDYCFWKKSIASIEPSDVDPVVVSDLQITTELKIATAGSCFAQHIAKRLNQKGFNYFVAEEAPVGMSAEESSRYGYGVFSARYGNLYTTRQLLQLFERAFGTFTPTIEMWQRPDGQFIDPFRPQITPDGYGSAENVLDAQADHFTAVRRMFKELDIFVFTLGLTECWEHIADGAILPIAPGVAGGKLDWDKYRFVNFNVEQVKGDLQKFLALLKAVNPKAKVLLTVSPVPLMATFEDRHVLVSTTISKSILRVVADEIVIANENVFYFPSYEIITGNFNKGAYYEDDLREIRPAGVDHVMRLFINHCTQQNNVNEATDSIQQEKVIVSSIPVKVISSSEIDELNEVICEEQLLDV